ncbi:MAG TPA: RNA methyltransferase, partial [Burkholderiaceae bacterium]|nr:RNA methyltransferase [Burkholderiaceae bacterium]
LRAGARMPARLKRITSRDNALYRQVHELAHSARERRKQGRSVIEGVHLCGAYAAAVGAPVQTVVAEGALADAEVAQVLRASEPAPSAVVSDELFRALSTLEQGVSIAFVVSTPRPGLPQTLDRDSVYLDRLQDPGNVGAILRSCAAAGVVDVLTAPQTAWCWSPKVLRAAMGAHFRLRIVESVRFAEVAPRLAIEAVATRAVGAESLWRHDLTAPRLWIFGNEGDGVSDEVAAQVTTWLRIPQQPDVESLNVAAAAAVCLFEQRRQRQGARGNADASAGAGSGAGAGGGDAAGS